MRKRQRLMPADEAGENFWPSFTDLTSTIVLILFVLVLLAYIQNLIAGKSLLHFKAQLSTTQTRLHQAQRRISSSQRQLRTLQGEIGAAQAQLKLSQQKLDDQRDVISNSNLELTDLRSQLQGIAVLRVDMLEKVKQSIEQELRPSLGATGPLVAVADNGNIRINESLVFEYDSYKIKNEGKRLLDTLARAFATVLADPKVRENVDVIVVQGHTDERGTVEYNRELSAKRADAVLNYMFESDPTLEQQYGAYFAASAYSEFRPINPAKTEAAYEQNRRIEISVVLKDARVRSVIDDYMRNLDPMLSEPQAAQ